jgi:hypothetical protein
MRAEKLREVYVRIRTGTGSHLSHTAALIQAAMKIGVSKKTARRYDSEMGLRKLVSIP